MGFRKLKPAGVFVPTIVTVSVEGTCSTPGAVGLDRVMLKVRLVCTWLLGRIATKMVPIKLLLKVRMPLTAV